MSNYRRGTRVEYVAREKLQNAGWFAVRAAGSHGDADVMAIRMARPWELGDQVDAEPPGIARALLVTCKRTITECYPDDWNRTYNAAIATGAIAVVAGCFQGKRGVRFMRMIGPKEKGHPSQPWEEFSIEEEEP